MFVVNWDNGASSCGTFSNRFTTYEEADTFGRDWASECNIRDKIDTNTQDVYTYEVIEIEGHAEADSAYEEAQYYDELNRGYSRDRI